MKKLLFIVLIVLILSCNKALDSKWDIDVQIPLVRTELNLTDFIPDSLTQVNSDQSISLILESTALKLDLDTLGTIQEISTKESFIAPFTSFDFAPGASFPTPLEETDLDFGDIELKEVHIKSGRLGLSVKSYIKEKLVADFSVISAELGTSNFTVQEIIPERIDNTPGDFYQEYDISGYQLDLTGENGDMFNSIVSSLNVIIDPAGNTVNVTNSDTLIVEIFYLDLVTQYARGYFGSQEINQLQESIDFELLNNLGPGAIDFNTVDFNLNLINGVGADFQFRIDELISFNSNFNSEVILDHEIIGSNININRATDNSGLAPVELHYTLNNLNSNIKEWVENFPDRIEYSLNANLNPLGNVSGGNDFIYCNSEFGIDISAEIPLCFAASDLILNDTLELSFNAEDNIDEIRDGTIELSVSNQFPLEGSLQLYLFENNMISDSLLSENELTGVITSSQNSGISANSKLIIPIESEKFEKLKNAEHIILNAVLNSPNFEEVKIYANQGIDVRAIIKANYLVDTE